MKNVMKWLVVRDMRAKGGVTGQRGNRSLIMLVILWYLNTYTKLKYKLVISLVSG